MKRKDMRAPSIAIVLGVLTLILGSYIAVWAQKAPDCTIWVTPGESIQEAIDEAPEGAVICLEAGTWAENLTISKSISLIGQGSSLSTIESLNACSPVLYVTTNGPTSDVRVRVEGLGVIGATGYWCESPPNIAVGVLVDGTAVVDLTGCAITDNSESGMRATDSAQVLVKDCTIADNGLDGIHVTNMASLAIEESMIRTNYYNGILVEDSSSVHAERNTIEGNEDAGIWCTSNRQVEGVGNTFFANGIDLVGNVGSDVRTVSADVGIQQIVYPHADYASLQEAVDSVAAGGEIILQDGTYWESIVVSREISITAEAEASLNSSSEWIPVVSLVEGGHLHLTDVEVYGGIIGVVVGADSRLVGTGCTFSGNEDAGILAQDFAGVTLSDCRISWNGWNGIEIGDSATLEMSHCVIVDQYDNGLVLQQESAAVVTECEFYWNSCGIRMEDAATLDLNESTISENYDCGILAEGSANVFRGGDNVIAANESDLSGPIPRSITLPSREPTEAEIVFPDPAYNDLQAAINALQPDGRLLLKEGVYEGNLVVWRDLWIEPVAGAAVEIKGANLALPTIDVIEEARLHLSNLTVSGGKDGIRAGGSSNLSATDVTVSGHLGKAIHLMNQTNATLTNCLLTDNGGGLYLSDTSHVEATDTTICFNSQAGISVSSAASVTGTNIELYANGEAWNGNLDTVVEVMSVEESAAMLFPNADYPTLQAAIDALPEGGELVLQEGTHAAGVTIDKQLSIRAQLGRRVDLVETDENLPVISLETGADLSLLDINITEGGEGILAREDANFAMLNCKLANLNKAMTVVDSATATLDACTIEDNELGIEIKDAGYLDLSASTIQRTKGDGLSLRGEATAQISNCEISNNTTGIDSTNQYYNLVVLLSWNGCGIRTYDSSRIWIQCTTLTGNGHGIDVRDESSVTIRSCTLSDNEVDGIRAWDSAHISVVECIIEDCGGIGDGIYLNGSSVAELEGCTVRRNGANAVHTTGESHAEIRDCDFLENALYGLQLEGESSVVALGTMVHKHDTASVVLSGSSSIEMRECKIADSQYGIHSQDSSGGMLCGNDFSDISVVGMFSRSAQMLEGTDNTFLRTGIDLKGNVSGQLRALLASPSCLEIVFPDPSVGSLQAALDHLLPGGVLWIREGEYSVNLTVANEVAIRAYPGDIVTLVSTINDVSVFSLVPGAELSLDNLRIDGGSEGISAHSAQLNIVGCTISGSSRQGIVLVGTSHLRIKDSSVYGCGSGGLTLANQATAQVDRCLIYDSGTGIEAQDATEVSVQYSSLSSNANYAVVGINEASILITDCFLLNNGFGVYTTDAARATLIANTIARTAGTAVTAFSTQPIAGSDNLLLENESDITGLTHSELRLTLREPTEQEIEYPNERYSSLQECVDALLPGGRLILESGIYDESLTIYKEVKIVGNPAERVEIHGEGGSFAILSLISGANLALSHVALTGGNIALCAESNAVFTLDSCSVLDSDEGGIWLLGSTKGHLTSCTFDAAGTTSVLVGSDAQISLDNCEIRHALETGILMNDSAIVSLRTTSVLNCEEAAVVMRSMASASFEECTIDGNKSGIQIGGQAEVVIRNSSVSNNAEYALEQTESSSSTWVDSLIASNDGGGISVTDSAQVELSNCQLSENGGTALLLSDDTQGFVTDCSVLENHSDGIRLSDTSTLEVLSSTISESLLSGLYLLDESYVSVTGSLINLNVHGIEMADSAQCHIDESDIQENRYSAIDLSDSSQVAARGISLSGNTLGARLRDSAAIEMTDCHVLNNKTGLLFLDSTEGICLSSAIQDNTYDGINLWGDAEVSMQSTAVSRNGRIDLSVCSVARDVSEGQEPMNVFTACGTSQQYPQDPPTNVLDVKESVVHVDIYATEPGYDELLWLDANGVIIEPGAVLTCWHLFMGEENPNQLVEIETLLVEDPDDYTAFMNTADLAGMIMNREYDLATLLTDRELSPALPVLGQAPPPQDIVWYVGNLDGDWYIIPGIITFPERSCIEYFLPYVSRDHTYDDPRLLARHYLPDAYATLRDDTQHGLSGGAVVTKDGNLIGILGPKPCGTDKTMGIWYANRAYDGDKRSP